MLLFLKCLLITGVYFTARTVGYQILQSRLGRLKFFDDRRIYRVEHAPDQIRREFIANIHYLVSETLMWSALFASGAIAPSGGSVILTFVAIAIWWDVSFYYVHRILHLRQFFFIHRQHHLAKVNSPLSGSSFSLIEGLIFNFVAWGPFVILGHWYPVAYLGAFAYNELLTFSRTTGHFNAEYLPQWWVKLKWTRWMQTPTFHALHHGRQSANFGLLTTFLDTWHKTRFADYELVHDRAFTKRGLRSFRERITAVAPASEVAAPKERAA